MKIYTRNAEEYIAMCLGLCGELEQEELLARAPQSTPSIYRAIKNLKDARVLIKHRYDDKRTFLRLSSKGGADYLAEVTPSLAANAKSIVNEELRYSGSKAQRLRERANYEFYSACLYSGIQINDMSGEYKQREVFEKEDIRRTEGESIFLEDGTPLPFEAIAQAIGSDYTGLFTKRVIKKKTDEGFSRGGSKNSRITGTLFIKSHPYEVYALLDAETSAWKPEAEFNASNYITGTIEANSPYFSKKGAQIENNCILAYPETERAIGMLKIADNNLRIDPGKVYQKAFVRPSCVLDDWFIALLGFTDPASRLTSALFPGSTRKGIEDATLDDGTEVYNFIGCDINRIRYAAPRIINGDRRSLVLIEDWMEDSLHKEFNKDSLQFVVLSKEELRTIADTLS